MNARAPTSVDDDEIDVAGLKQIIRHFRLRNAERLDGARTRLTPSSRLVLDTLPYLLHVNSASAPGYCGSQCPAGVAGYRADALTRTAMRQVAPTHRLADPFLAADDIKAVFLMGSVGSVAQTRDSDLDVWVCLPRAQHAALQPKLDLLTEWATDQHVQLQIFAVDPIQFQLSEGHHTPLLLDEFYRTACLLAGHSPLWWLVPPDVGTGDYQRFAVRLEGQQFLRREPLLDFGPVREFAPLDLLRASARELATCLETPHKSLLKIALLESYQQGATPLSMTYKARVQGGARAGSLDPYLMLGEHLDAHFTGCDDIERRDFLRRAWLIKTARGNAHLTRSTEWRAFLDKWSVPRHRVEHLRWPAAWPLHELQAEHRRTMQALEAALAFAQQLAEAVRPDPETADNLARVAAALKHIRAHPEQLLPTLVPDGHTSRAEIVEVPKDREARWHLKDDGQVIVRRRQLVGVLCWLQSQGLTLSSLTAQSAKETRLRQLDAALREHEQLIVLNAEATSVTPWDETGNALITPEDDPLSYGKQRLCLVHTCDVVQPGDGEPRVTSTSLEGALCLALQMSAPAVMCTGDIRRSRIQARVREVLAAARITLQHSQAGHAFQLARDLCVLLRNAGGRPTWQRLRSAWESAHITPTLAQLNSGAEDQLTPGYRDLVHAGGLTAPSLWITPVNATLRILYRASGTRQLVYSANDDGQALQALLAFVWHHHAQGGALPLVFNLDRYLGVDTARPATGQGTYLAFEQSARGWQVHIDRETWFDRPLNRTLLRAIINDQRQHHGLQAGDPLYLHHLQLIGSGDFMQHLRLKLRLEQLLRRLNA